MNIVENKFIEKAIVRPGGMMIFSKKNAIDFVYECQKEAIIILGIDAFYLYENDKIQPVMEHGINYSSFDRPAAPLVPYESVVDFLKSKDDNLFFEINCID